MLCKFTDTPPPPRDRFATIQIPSSHSVSYQGVRHDALCMGQNIHCIHFTPEVATLKRESEHIPFPGHIDFSAVSHIPQTYTIPLYIEALGKKIKLKSSTKTPARRLEVTGSKLECIAMLVLASSDVPSLSVLDPIHLRRAKKTTTKEPRH